MTKAIHLKLFIALMAYIVIAAVFGNVHASAVFRGDKASCEHFAKVVHEVAGVRDSGVPWEIMEPQLTSAVNDAKGNPASYINSDSDVNYVLDKLKGLWATKMGGFEYAAKVYSDCMQKTT